MSRTLHIRLIAILFAFNVIQVGLALLWNVSWSHADAKPVAVLVNNDDSIRHKENIIAAREACQKFGIEPIVVQGENGRLPSRKQIEQAFQMIKREKQNLVLIYLTGHGSLLFSGEDKPTSTIHFKDGPLAPGGIAKHIHGDCVVYIDVCFAPGWINALAKQAKESATILSDKPIDDQQRSCRGTSQLLWRQMINDSDSSFKESLLTAWNDTCPGGVSNQ